MKNAGIEGEVKQTEYLTAPLKTDKMPPGVPFIVGNDDAAVRLCNSSYDRIECAAGLTPGSAIGHQPRPYQGGCLIKREHPAGEEGLGTFRPAKPRFELVAARVAVPARSTKPAGEAELNRLLAEVEAMPNSPQTPKGAAVVSRGK